MTEVTIDNFDNVFPIIKDCIKNAVFVAFDNEMSGLTSENNSTYSLFDAPSERYLKVKQNIDPFIIMQTGLTTFRHLRDDNKFVADTFNFYVMPRSIPTQNRHFVWQSSAIQFLSQHGFNFNKFAYRSLSYMNETEEKELREQVYNGTFLQLTADYIPIEISGDVEDKVNSVHDWLNSESHKDTLELDVTSPLMEYLLHRDIRIRFNKVWTKTGINQVIVQKVEAEDRDVFVKEERKYFLEDRLISFYLGFSKVFKLLIAAKKPIVGHNIFTDLMFMYKQFYKPLPKHYQQFKNDIHKMFPVIYDTKNLSYNLKDLLKRTEKWKRNGLEDMYTYFTNEKGYCLAMHTPEIEKNQSLQFIDTAYKAHDAAADSYFAGYIFIKMAHVLAVKKYGRNADLKVLTCKEIMSGVKEFENCVNVIRALISHVNFSGRDPECKRPHWLYAQVLGSKNFTEVTEMLSSFGNVDVKPITPYTALVAVGNHSSAKDILKYFKSHDELRIVPYNPIFHSDKATYLLWGGVLIVGGFFASTLLTKTT